jgi:cell division protein FtsB
MNGRSLFSVNYSFRPYRIRVDQAGSDHGHHQQCNLQVCVRDNGAGGFLRPARFFCSIGLFQVDQAKRLKELEQENSKLKRLVAELSLDKQILQDIARGNF